MLEEVLVVGHELAIRDEAHESDTDVNCGKHLDNCCNKSDIKGLGLRGEAPTFNRCIINSGGVPHSVSILAPDAPIGCPKAIAPPLTLIFW